MHQAQAAYDRGDWARAEGLCRAVLRNRPEEFEALSLLGVISVRTGRPAEAVEWLERARALRPGDAAGHNNHGFALAALGRKAEALASYEQACRVEPRFAQAHNNRGNVLQDLGRPSEAIACYAAALAINPDYAEAHNNLGNAFRSLRRFDEALASYEQALRIRPDFVEVLNNRGNVLRDLRRFDSALGCYEQALRHKADVAEIHNNLGLTLHDLGRDEEAAVSCERALELKPESADAHNNYGLVLHGLGRFEAALESYARALAFRPDFAQAYGNRGLVLYDLGRTEEAVADYERALALSPDYEWLRGTWLYARMQLCDWRDLDACVLDLTSRIAAGQRATPPFPLLAVSDSLALHRRAVEIWVNEACRTDLELPPLVRRPRGRRIRLGYYSADYHRHATSHLTAGLFETHDRERFEVVGLSFGADFQDDLRQRIVAAFDQFIDVRGRSDRQIAQLSRDLGIDIAVDLKGFTHNRRTGMFAYRVAPIQVNYLGYPGTLCAPCLDYIIADPTLIPAEARPHYCEKIVYLPHSYQVNDRKREIADIALSRAELGLPEDAFVFCAFNSVYKITPAMFDVWMRLLRQLGGSVLWLVESNPVSVRNLRREAEARGVSGERLLFGPEMKLEVHLARYRAADLFLDAFPCNGHTTASDALWAGVPVLTRMGESFASRVAASLLRAIGLPELITTSAEQYEATALALARDPARLAAIRRTLHDNRLTMPLFDTALFTRHIECAYHEMYERYQSGLDPEHIVVAP